MRDKTHDKQIERWANYVKNNPDWKKKLKPFLDSQILISKRIYKKLNETDEGKQKIIKLRQIRGILNK
ncbi:MAG TPA: hypothetical protein VJH65_02720 [Candidatus Nanoarchaeia archaeon]|nr:hypothetical protein [Candidatus Nanoarchaeia archaeon]